MDPFAPMAHQLLALPQPMPHVQKNAGMTERLRQELRGKGQRTARELAEAVGLANTGKVSAILKKDRQAGRVLIVDGFYSWNDAAPVPPPVPCDGRTRVRDILDWHEIADDDFPDADLNVLGRLRDNDEPVWIVHYDGEEWLDTDGRVVDVVRWAELPAGGEV